MGSFTQASWQDHAMLQLSSGPRQHVAALLPKTNSAWVPNSVLGVSSDNPERRGDKRSRNLPYFFKVSFFPFCFVFSIVLGQGMQLCRICYLKQMLKRPNSETYGKNMSKMNLKSKVRLFPFVFC